MPTVPTLHTQAQKDLMLGLAAHERGDGPRPTTRSPMTWEALSRARLIEADRLTDLGWEWIADWYKSDPRGRRPQ